MIPRLVTAPPTYTVPELTVVAAFIVPSEVTLVAAYTVAADICVAALMVPNDVTLVATYKVAELTCVAALMVLRLVMAPEAYTLVELMAPAALMVVTAMLEFRSSLLSLRLMKLLSSSEFVRGLFLAVTPMPLVVDLVIKVVIGSHRYYYNLYKTKGVVLATPLFV